MTSLQRLFEQHAEILGVLEDANVKHIMISPSGRFEYVKLGRQRAGSAPLDAHHLAELHQSVGAGPLGDWMVRAFPGAWGPTYLLERRPTGGLDRLPQPVNNHLKRMVRTDGMGLVFGGPGASKSNIMLWLANQWTEDTLVFVSENPPSEPPAGHVIHVYPPSSPESRRDLERLVRLNAAVFWDRASLDDMRTLMTFPSGKRRWAAFDAEASDIPALLRAMDALGISARLDTVLLVATSVIGRPEVQNLLVREDGVWDEVFAVASSLLDVLRDNVAPAAVRRADVPPAVVPDEQLEATRPKEAPVSDAASTSSTFATRPEPVLPDLKPEPPLPDMRPEPVLPDLKPAPVLPMFRAEPELPPLKSEPVLPEIKPSVEPVLPEIPEERVGLQERSSMAGIRKRPGQPTQDFDNPLTIPVPDELEASDVAGLASDSETADADQHTGLISNDDLAKYVSGGNSDQRTGMLSSDDLAKYVAGGGADERTGMLSNDDLIKYVARAEPRESGEIEVPAFRQSGNLPEVTRQYADAIHKGETASADAAFLSKILPTIQRDNTTSPAHVNLEDLRITRVEDVDENSLENARAIRDAYLRAQDLDDDSDVDDDEDISGVIPNNLGEISDVVNEDDVSTSVASAAQFAAAKWAGQSAPPASPYVDDHTNPTMSALPSPGAMDPGEDATQEVRLSDKLRMIRQRFQRPEE